MQRERGWAEADRGILDAAKYTVSALLPRDAPVGEKLAVYDAASAGCTTAPGA